MRNKYWIKAPFKKWMTMEETRKAGLALCLGPYGPTFLLFPQMIVVADYNKPYKPRKKRKKGEE